MVKTCEEVQVRVQGNRDLNLYLTAHCMRVNPFTEPNTSPSPSRARVKRPSRVKKDESEENPPSNRVRSRFRVRVLSHFIDKDS
jgi:hypothetical protein